LEGGIRGGSGINLRRRIPLLLLCLHAWAQAPAKLTLADAQKIALQNEPRLASASLTAQAAGQVVKEARSAYFPTVAGNLTSVGAEEGTAVAAGALTTSSLSSRLASGLVVSQLITDFGRTSNLAGSAKLRAQAQDQNVVTTRAQILLNVQQAYYAALGAQAVEGVAQAALDNRRLVLRQIDALAASSLKSTLDVRFAQVAVSETELELYQAQNDFSSAQARLSAALGYNRTRAFTLAEEFLPAPLNPDPDPLIAEALRQRPELASLSLNRDAARRFAEAEKDLRNPTLSALATAGVVPTHDAGYHGDNYAAAGVNLNIPIFNGGLFAARRSEADLRAQAADKDIEELTLQISKDVRIAWLDANNAFRRLDVAARLVDEANEALRLAQTRYDAGLGSIVELTQAQYTQTSAQIGAASAKYDYLSRRSALDYTTGVLR
jgi:outer membrane protein